MRLNYFLYVLFFLFLFSSCDDDKNKSFLPWYIGKPGEVLVVYPSKSTLNAVNDTLTSYLKEIIQPENPFRPEYAFSVYSILDKNFSKLQKSHGNIITIHIANKYQEPEVEYIKDLWARGQRVILIKANSNSEVRKLVYKYGEQWVNYFNNIELSRLVNHYKLYPNKEIKEFVNLNNQIDLNVINSMKIASFGSDYLWLNSQRLRNKMTGDANGGFQNVPHDIIQGIFIYEYPYISDSAFGLNELVNNRNKFFKSNIKLEKDSAFMVTEMHQGFQPSIDTVTFNKNFAVKLKGMWRTEHDYMGGVFVSISFLDVTNSKVICLDSYLYAPKFGKREYLRELEAMLYSYKKL